ncbi:MAG: hypothetical protein KKC68_00880 [Candidatus Thermoplasmatota archaeon]|nr:hypothetical protein [Candidatus Thermoplasmatota archaeon]MBU1940305.1 hypothetical protein [Candidatus Thermoplasmatota archaeon]
MNQERTIQYTILIVSFAIALIVILGIYQTSTTPIPFYERLIIGSLFIVINTSGAIAALRPGILRRILRISQPTSQKGQKKQLVRLQGHHPTCGRFIRHTLTYRKKIYCAGCLGLAIGAIIANIVMIIYIWRIVQLSTTSAFILLVISLFLIIHGFTELFWLRSNEWYHTFTNILFILGFALLVFAVLERTNDITNGIISIIFSILWVDARIYLSRWKHQQICRQCTSKCSFY